MGDFPNEIQSHLTRLKNPPHDKLIQIQELQEAMIWLLENINFSEGN